MFGRPPDYLAEPAVPEGHSSPRPEDEEAFDAARLQRPVRFALVAQRTLRSRGHPEPAETPPLRLQYTDMDGAGTVQDRAQRHLVAR